MKTRCGSLASRTARSNSRPASETGTPRTRTWRARRSTTSSPDLEHVGRAGGRATQHRVDPRHELRIELALGDVVGSALERAHALHGIGARGGEHDHRNVAVPAAAGLPLAEPRAQLGLAGEHDVRPRALGDVERLSAPARLDDVEAVRAADCARDSPARAGRGRRGGGLHAWPPRLELRTHRRPVVLSAECVTIAPQPSGRAAETASAVAESPEAR